MRKEFKAPLEVIDSHEEIMQKLSENIKNGSRLSFIEFCICNTQMRLDYIQKGIDTKCDFQNFVFKWADEEWKLKIINSRIEGKKSIPSYMLEFCPKDLLLSSFDAILEAGGYLNENQKEFCTSEQWYKSIMNRAKSKLGDGWLEYEDFKLLDEEWKLEYILMNGYINLDTEIRKWYDMYRKAKNRENQIDSILK